LCLQSPQTTPPPNLKAERMPTHGNMDLKTKSAKTSAAETIMNYNFRDKDIL